MTKRSISLTSPWAVVAITAIFATTLGAPHVAAAQAATTNDSIESLTLSRDRVRAERHRWEKLVEVQQTLAQHPDRLAEATEAASRELKGNGTALVVEGLTGGLSNFLSLQAEYALAVNDKSLAQRYRVAAAFVSASYTSLIKDLVTQQDPGRWKPSTAANDTINKLNTALALVIVTQVKDPDVRRGLSASLDLSKGLSGFLTAYLNDDQVTMAKLLPSLQAVLGGTLAMTKALAAKASKEELRGLAATLAQRIPAFEQVAAMMATTALADANISLALANIGWGSYALTMGMDLAAQAEEIRDKQQLAAIRLQRLLPRARLEIARAKEIEQRLTASIEAIKPAPPPRMVLPSTRFVDSWGLGPATAAALPDTLSAIRATPSLAISITVAELDRRQDQFRRATEQERAEERRRLEEARRAAREEARRRAAEQRRWAQLADIENDTRSAPSSSHSVTDRSTSYDMSGPWRAFENAQTWKLP